MVQRTKMKNEFHISATVVHVPQFYIRLFIWKNVQSNLTYLVLFARR